MPFFNFLFIFFLWKKRIRFWFVAGHLFIYLAIEKKPSSATPAKNPRHWLPPPYTSAFQTSGSFLPPLSLSKHWTRRVKKRDRNISAKNRDHEWRKGAAKKKARKKRERALNDWNEGMNIFLIFDLSSTQG